MFRQTCNTAKIMLKCVSFSFARATNAHVGGPWGWMQRREYTEVVCCSWLKALGSVSSADRTVKQSRKGLATKAANNAVRLHAAWTYKCWNNSCFLCCQLPKKSPFLWENWTENEPLEAGWLSLQTTLKNKRGVAKSVQIRWEEAWFVRPQAASTSALSIFNELGSKGVPGLIIRSWPMR